MPAKVPKVLKIYKQGCVGSNEYDVYITMRQLEKLPLWVRNAIQWCESYDNYRHVIIPIYATDELQAFARFKQLWTGLPEE